MYVTAQSSVQRYPSKPREEKRCPKLTPPCGSSHCLFPASSDVSAQIACGSRVLPPGEASSHLLLQGSKREVARGGARTGAHLVFGLVPGSLLCCPCGFPNPGCSLGGLLVSVLTR